MTDFYHRIENMWWHGQAPLLLRFLAKFYALLSRKHLQYRVRHAIAPSLPMISIGNITVGGSGKTPFVNWLAKELVARDFTPVILCRGDGRKSKETAMPKVVCHDDLADDVGDEALMLHRLSHCPVISGSDRQASAAMAHHYGDIILLDDGYQYRQLQRICDIVLVPAVGVGNANMLPAGPLREPVDALERADFLVRTGHGEALPLGNRQQWHWQTEEQPVQIAGEVSLLPTQMLAVCAIARPERFMHSLNMSGILIRNSLFYPDHHRFTMAHIAKIQANGLPVIVTEKDAIKIKPMWRSPLPLWVMQQKGKGEKGLIDAIMSHLEQRCVES
ncbi:MAG: tetraacyldisaccharide 4'-kinase [Mariprofundaceae bacterium]